jgi:cytoskeletal protein CcmA (bactofilin family)
MTRAAMLLKRTSSPIPSSPGGFMLNRDTFFKKQDDTAKRGVNVTPALATPASPQDNAQRPTVTTAARSDLISSADRSKNERHTGSKLIVGPDIKLKGAEITDCDTLVVEGTVEASMDSRVIQIAEHGVFKRTVSIDIAEIHGRFEGELTAREQLIVHATGRVSGKIRYGKIQIEEGGEICGDMAKADTKPVRAAQTLLKSASTD